MKGRQHPVKIYHTINSQPDYADAAVRTFFQIHVDQDPGDVLIFLPGDYSILCLRRRNLTNTQGQEDIEAVQHMIKSYASQLPLDYMSVSTFIDLRVVSGRS